MFCEHCGYQISNEANFCPRCGTPVHGAKIKNTSLTSSKELDREAIKIYLNDVLSLECVNHKLKSSHDDVAYNISSLKKSNYRKDYPLEALGQYISLFYDGKSYYLARIKEFGKMYVHLYGFNYQSKWSIITDETIRSVAKWPSGMAFSYKSKCMRTLLSAYEDFKNTAPSIYKENLRKIDNLSQVLSEITNEWNNANSLLKKAYQVNILPAQFRNLYAVYYLHEFMDTSHESLTTALMHYDLKEIKEKLDTIIRQQREIIIQQAIMTAQNEKLLQQNTLQLKKLSSIEKNSEQATQYAEIAAINAEACAWINYANYIRK